MVCQPLIPLRNVQMDIYVEKEQTHQLHQSKPVQAEQITVNVRRVNIVLLVTLPLLVHQEHIRILLDNLHVSHVLQVNSAQQQDSPLQLETVWLAMFA